jgi:hypothetical protein
VVYYKHPFGGPKEVLRYLARYTHRVAISNCRLIACDETGVTFKWKDYRLEGPERYQVMTLATHQFIRRFVMQTTNLCPCCGGRMIIIERVEQGATPHYRASPLTPAIRIYTS